MRRLSFDRDRLHAFYAEGGRPEDVVAEAFRRLDAADDPGIFISLAEREALAAEARSLPPFDPQRHPLWGLPFAVKDNIDAAGFPTTAACPAFAYRPTEDAPAVARLKAAGALCLGKTNLDQFATGLVGLRTPYPVPRNAVDAKLPPGGSSSGSAVAVARGIAAFALGTDTAGSGRVPAALNNIVGLKPSLGAISTRGVVPACRTLDCVSVFALTAPDAWAAFEVAAAPDLLDPFSRERPIAPLIAPNAPFRVGVPREGGRRFSGDILQAGSFAAALERLRRLGAEVVEIDFEPFHAVAALLYEGPWVAERLAAVRAFRTANPGALHPVTEQIIGAAESFSAVDAFEGFYRLAELRREAEASMVGLDLLAVPSIPTFHDIDALAADPIGPNSDYGTYTNFANLLDLCAVATPTGRRPDGRPGSVTLLAAGGADGRVAAVAAALHADSASHLGATSARPGPLRTSLARAAPEEETTLLAVGSHMTGLPLEGELRAHGGRPIGPVRTAPCYRLAAFPGTPPRPGLWRVAEGGAPIEGELWRLPVGAIGKLLATIPSPLGFGRVTLEDGSETLGFLGEAAACMAAPDVTASGGWRRHLSLRGKSAEQASAGEDVSGAAS